MKKLLVLFIFFYSLTGVAQDYFDDELSCFDAKSRISVENLAKAKKAFPGDANIDVTYYFLDLNIDVNNQFLNGVVRVDYLPLVSDLNQVLLDLHDAYTIDSVRDDSNLLTFVHENNVLKVDVPVLIDLDAKPSSIFVYYRGAPPKSNSNFSFQFSTHGSGNTPVVWTLSEPYDAPRWWPCVDNPADKADSCDVWITMNSFYTAVSQGVLKELVHNEDGTNTAKWKHRYPISQYLISVAASNYILIKDEYEYTDSSKMDVLHYLYPEVAADPRISPLINSTIDMLDVFSKVYGEYPFIQEKYGHAMFGFGGGMEHQTISSMGGFSTGLIAHELGHQWFGDKVTCKTWRDIWVNEGFAEFSSLYYFEQSRGKAEYDGRVAFHMNAAKGATGTVSIENTASVGEIFDFARTYQKGSIILHMLRGVLGDELFFKSLKEYQTTEFAYGAATIEDFKAVAERVSGQDLGYFFDEWLFGTGYPVYTYSWHQMTDNKLLINVKHQGTQGTSTFSMPIEAKIIYEDGTERIEKLFINENDLTIEFENESKPIADVLLDPNNWILKDLTQVAFDAPLAMIEELNLTLYPNPAAETLNIILPENILEISLLNNLGQKVTKFDQVRRQINLKYLPSGRYFVLLKNANNKVFSKSFIKQ